MEPWYRSRPPGPEWNMRAGRDYDALFICSYDQRQEQWQLQWNRTSGCRAVIQPNALGSYDMHGNIWEWVCDWSGP